MGLRFVRWSLTHTCELTAIVGNVASPDPHTRYHTDPMTPPLWLHYILGELIIGFSMREADKSTAMPLPGS